MAEKELPQSITVFQSLQSNWRSWAVIGFVVTAVSYPQIPQGLATFVALIVLSYAVHYGSHFCRTPVTILHHYHHEQTDFLSHFAQVLIELSFGLWLLPIHALWPAVLDVVHGWTVMLFSLFYSTVHNWNYGQCHVNEVHRRHHESVLHNVGPDICDVLFGTKHPDDQEVENTDHYIPNVLAAGAVVLLLKQGCATWPEMAEGCVWLGWVSGILIYALLAITSVYLFFTYP